jgi:hypothetical protein
LRGGQNSVFLDPIFIGSKFSLKHHFPLRLSSKWAVLDKLEALKRTAERLEHNGTRAHIQNIEFKNLASQHGALKCKN